MGIIGIYRSSATHWYKFGVRIRCVVPKMELFSLFSPPKTVTSQEKLFSLIEIGKTALSREQHNV